MTDWIEKAFEDNLAPTTDGHGIVHIVKATRGRMDGPEAAGPNGECVCTDCGHKIPHKTGKPCSDIKCPECGSQMTREADTES